MRKLRLAIILIAIGGFLAYVSVPNALALLKSAYDIQSAPMESIKTGDHVRTDITSVVSCIISETTTTTKNGVKQSERESARYYLVPVVVEEKNGDVTLDHMFILRLQDNFGNMILAEGAFNNWWDSDAPMDEYPDTVYFALDGRVRRMNSKEREAVENYTEDPDYADYIAPYIVVPIGNVRAVWLMLAASVLAFGLAILLIVLNLRKGKKNTPAAPESGEWIPQETQ